ncbi:MAG: phospho-N-acetylmuramoyl-pentapeptide-transferase [Spirochaetes bacterium GWD1_61_31]|nr:MAG: phospho-N-acetylmuramoyl-pentapeptide-transferase [Spirochaetes bacterium GWB1_60_80]OHD34718.1 MAG: phospho-N-acetylmuramoyl-pentapeptide-transferase [Spirochaetes bacterium GWC1_61_12]OHD38748.1 MAG: phospho-N-acetylmuramoyl-pentapeptide-transferase [Spirochaetes bacterium GWD1_61_31]OHD44493.1 MAG: phospho-N-acetylmuramoyl-pentapeptide-transferase [Spirochaetes bacterium GWE1_60_18]OHD59357.1 MAG: phospho-N-acetylmuramoyl-pentapeptide-transferase [Spirochaetes bacterium GWF1_60_12]H
MFLEWIYPLVRFFTPLNVFRYLTFRSAYAAVTALLLAFLLGPKVIEKLRAIKFGQSVRLDGPQSHLVKSGTPTMGGVLILLSVSAAVLLWVDLTTIYSWVCLGSLLGFGVIGFMDDYLKIKKKNSDGLSAKAKLALQFLVAATAVLILYLARTPDTTMLYLPFFKNAVVDLGFFWVPIAIVYVVAWSNAVNLTDGLDGLATGLVIMAVIAFSLITYLSGRADWSEYLGIPFIRGTGELTVFTMALMGACVGFLWFNAHPAEVFMGDVGSLGLGGVLAVLALIVKKEVLLFIVGGVFVLEEASVIIQVIYFKLTKGRRVFKMAPLHHHFELVGWKETKVVARFWILGGLFALIALSTLKIQ